MKKICSALILLALMVGCGPRPPQPWVPPAPPTPTPTPNPQPQPAPDPTPLQPPATIAEAQNGQTYGVKTGANLKFAFNVNTDSNYFWSLGIDRGDFEVVSEGRQNGKHIFNVQCNQTGILRFTYKRFGDMGAEQLSELVYGVVVK
jgi:predicted secreted protein